MLDLDKELTITTADLARLEPVLDVHDTPASELLDFELRRARVVDPAAVPADVATMNSEVVYEDSDTLEKRAVRLCYPRDANAAAGRISVLAPIGSALLGLRVGQSISWPVPGGTKRIRLVAVRYQPEASGDFHL